MNSKDILDALAKATVTRVEKPWGEELIIYPDGIHDLQIKVITVRDGKRTSLQHHPVGREVAFVLSGDGTIVNEEQYTYEEGGSYIHRDRPSRPIELLPVNIHRSVGPVTLLEFTTAGPHDIVRHNDDFGREGKTGE